MKVTVSGAMFPSNVVTVDVQQGATIADAVNKAQSDDHASPLGDLSKYTIMTGNAQLPLTTSVREGDDISVTAKGQKGGEE